jgi:hypothetical protein
MARGVAEHPQKHLPETLHQTQAVHRASMALDWRDLNRDLRDRGDLRA